MIEKSVSLKTPTLIGNQISDPQCIIRGDVIELEQALIIPDLEAVI